MKIHFNQVFGLGCMWDVWPIVSDDCGARWQSLHFKIVLLNVCLTGMFRVPFTTRRGIR